MRGVDAVMLAVALSACGDDKAVDEKNASTATVAKKVADAGMKLNPGRWELTMKFSRFDIEGMPPEAKQQMQGMLGQNRTFTSCLTKEQAEKPDGSFFGQQGDECRYDRFVMGDGKIDAAMTCKGEGDQGMGAANMTLAGTYSADNYDMTMDMQGTAPNGKAMNMAMSLVSKRVGECRGDEQTMPKGS